MAEKRQLGKYEIDEQVGRGGFATVYRASDPDLKRLVALKLLHQQFLMEPDFIARFQREAQAAAGLRHRNIVTIYETGRAQNQIFIAMEYLSGPNLERVIKEKAPFDVDRTVELLRPVAKALDYAHKRNFIHRDVKPSNIILNEHGEPILTDFGLARPDESTASRLTMSGVTMGTPDYMAPEQIRPVKNRPLDHLCDLYALGVVAYEMLTGRVPFDGTTTFEVQEGHVRKPPPPPRQLNPEIEPEVEAALLRQLAKEPDDRISSAEGFVDALAEAAAAARARIEREQKLEELRQMARRAIQGQQWEQALAWCDEMASIDSQFPPIATLREEAEQGKAKADELRRQQELIRLEEEARNLLQTGKWPEALALCTQMAGVDPQHTAIRELSEAARQGQAAEERRRQILILHQQVVAALQDERWDNALALCDQIEKLDPRYENLPELRQRAQDGRDKAVRQQRLMELDAQARDAINDAKWGLALALVDRIAELDPAYGPAQKLRSPAEAGQRKDRLAQLEQQALAALDEGDADKALRCCDQMAEIDREYPAIVHIRRSAMFLRLSQGGNEPFVHVVRTEFGTLTVEMVPVAAGEFTFGGPGGHADELPQRTIHLAPFGIARYPITNRQYRLFVVSSGYRPPDHWRDGFYPSDEADHPVVNLSWHDAQAFCQWADLRLPTEAEWEKAARGGDERSYPWGNRFDAKKCNTAASKIWETTPVNRYQEAKAESPYGVVDASGNMWEWVNDWYDAGAYRDASSQNPQGPSAGQWKILRGGSWFDPPALCRATNRSPELPDCRSDNIGFRPAL